MALEKIVELGNVQIAPDATVFYKTVTKITEDGGVLSENFHKYTILPGDDYSSAPAMVQSICSFVQTPDAIQAFRQKSLENDQKMKELLQTS